MKTPMKNCHSKETYRSAALRALQMSKKRPEAMRFYFSFTKKMILA